MMMIEPATAEGFATILAAHARRSRRRRRRGGGSDRAPYALECPRPTEGRCSRGCAGRQPRSAVCHSTQRVRIVRPQLPLTKASKGQRARQHTESFCYLRSGARPEETNAAAAAGAAAKAGRES